MRTLRPHAGARGFTLIELLLAITISAVILAAVNAVLFGALRLRNRTSRMLEDSVARQQALSILKRDLAGIVAPGGETNMAGALLYGGMNGVTDAAGTGMQLFTTSGIVSDYTYWGELQKVAYILREPTNNAAPAIGRDLWHRDPQPAAPAQRDLRGTAAAVGRRPLRDDFLRWLQLAHFVGWHE